MNPVQGCAHGCRYPCYAYLMALRFGRVKSYADWIKPALVTNTLEVLARELDKSHKKIRHVQLCLTTDPFMVGYPEVGKTCLESIRLINAYDIPCSVLTKGILPIELADLDPRNTYGISLSTLDEEFRKRWEPFSAPYAARINALKALHERGMQTWVHMEPYPTPNIIVQELEPILEAVNFAERIDLMRWNYSAKSGHFPDPDSFYQAAQEQLQSFLDKRKRSV